MVEKGCAYLFVYVYVYTCGCICVYASVDIHLCVCMYSDAKKCRYNNVVVIVFGSHMTQMTTDVTTNSK